MKYKGVILIVLIFALSGIVASAKTIQKQSMCGIENCHGLDITCGPNVPQACTAMYALGDFCRQFAQCQVVEGSCQFVPSARFQSCKSCVQDCMDTKDPLQAFECEHHCRELFPVKEN